MNYFFSIVKIAVVEMSLKELIVIFLTLNFVFSIEDFSFMKESASKIKSALLKSKCNVTIQNIKDYETEDDKSFPKFLIKYNEALDEVEKAINKG